jgi:tetratricopeptide (TPR) repeat protein
MKSGQILTILAFLMLAGCFLQPVVSAANVTASTGPKDNATTYYNNGDLLVVRGEYENAITLFDLALASNTSMIEKTGGLLYLYRDKAYAQIQLGRYNDALTTLVSGLAQYPNDALLWNNQGYAFFRLGKPQDALTSYDTALSFDQNYTTALINKGDTLISMGRYTDAITAYTRANETDPGNQAAAEGITKAQAGSRTSAESTARTMSIILVVVLVAAAGAAVWYFKFRKPKEPAPAESTETGKKSPAGKKTRGKKN